MQPGSAGIILAGGRSRRMGADKALLEIGGETLLARTVNAVSAVVTEVLIVGRTELPPELTGYPAIEDVYLGAGPLGGIATGLEHTGAERALVVACDLPFLQIDLLRLLLRPAEGYDAVVPVPQGRPQPTCALYARSCVPVMKRRLAARSYRLRDLLDEIEVRWVRDQEIRSVDPEYRSFLNANTPEEWMDISRGQ